MTEEDAKKLLSGELWKSAEDGEAAGRLVARGFSGEMRRLCDLFGLDKSAEGEKTETPPAEAAAEAATTEVDPIMNLVEELGGKA